MVIQVPLTLYTVPEAIRRFRELTGLEYTDTGLRNRMRSAQIPIYRIGNQQLNSERDLLLLARLPVPRRGRPRKKVDN